MVGPDSTMTPPAHPPWTHGCATLGALAAQHRLESGPIVQAEVEIPVRRLQKPGALRGGVAPFATVFEDAAAVKRGSQSKLAMPVLALGGERGAGATMLPAWQALAANVEGGVMAGAGHWIADEPPAALAARLQDVFTRVEEDTQ